MKKGLIGLLSLMLVAMLTGCGGGEPEPEADAPAMMSAEEKEAAKGNAEGSGAVSVAPAAEEAPAEAPAAAPAEAAAPAPEAAAAPAEVMEAKTEAPAGVDGLIGSSWKYDEIDLTFIDASKVKLMGGPLAAIAPDGTEGSYTLGEDGAFEVSVMGQTYSGTYDGMKLVVDGKDAVKQ